MYIQLYQSYLKDSHSFSKGKKGLALAATGKKKTNRKQTRSNKGQK